MVTTTLQGLKVAHVQHGPGVITAINNASVTIDLGVSTEGLDRSDPFIYNVLSEIDDIYPTMRIQAKTNSVLDSSSWKILPESKEVLHAIKSIPGMNTGVVIPTSNPKKPYMLKLHMYQKHLEMMDTLRLGTITDVTKIISNLAYMLDWQLSWALLQGREPLSTYHDRLRNISSRLGGDSWKVALDHVPDDSTTFAYSMLATLSGLYSVVSDEVDLMGAIDLVFRNSEQRMAKRSTVVAGFTKYVEM